MPANNRSGRVRRFFGDAEHDFCLRIGELIDLEEKHDCGPGFMIDMFLANRWKVAWMKDILRLGLQGSEEMQPTMASAYVTRHFRECYILDYLQTCADIIAAALQGAKDDKPAGEPEAPTETMTPSPEAESVGAVSSTKGVRRATRRKKSGE